MNDLDENDIKNNKNLKINLSDNKKCYNTNHNNLYKHLNKNLDNIKKNKAYIDKLQDDINEYNNLKCEYKQFTRISVFFIIISFIMILTKKMYKYNEFSITLIFYVTFINLVLSLLFHYDYCPRDYKFHLRIIDIMTAVTIWSIGLYYGNNYTYGIGISMFIIYFIETYYHKYLSYKDQGILHSFIHILHPIMMYSVITFL